MTELQEVEKEITLTLTENEVLEYIKVLRQHQGFIANIKFDENTILTRDESFLFLSNQLERLKMLLDKEYKIA